MRIALNMLILMVLVCACGDNRSGEDEYAYAKAVETWRSDRLVRLKAPDGFLNLVGLYWLPEGVSSFGADADNDIVFTGGPDRIGSFDVSDGRVRMSIADGVDVRVNDQRVDTIVMPDDLGQDSVTATLGSLAWTVINREGKLGIRLRDFENPVLSSFSAMPYFPIDEEFRVPARLRRYDEPKVTEVDTVVEGLGWNPTSPGVVEFDLRGESFALEAYEVDDRLFFVFADRTSGRDTYPAGRFLYAERPGRDGLTALDFNLAYSPPCAFNDFSTCPVASPRNRLDVAVTAGEKYDRNLQAGATY